MKTLFLIIFCQKEYPYKLWLTIKVTFTKFKPLLNNIHIEGKVSQNVAFSRSKLLFHEKKTGIFSSVFED